METLNVKQVAGLLRLSRRTVFRLMEAGVLRRLYDNRYTADVDPAELRRFLAACPRWSQLQAVNC